MKTKRLLYYDMVVDMILVDLHHSRVVEISDAGSNNAITSDLLPD